MSKAASSASRALETAGAVTGPAGLVLELVGNLVQIGVGAAQYAEIADCNRDFNQALRQARR